MLERLSKRIALWLINSGLLKETDCELCTYAINYLLLIILPTIVFTIYCVITHNIWIGLIEIFSFLLIRKYSGGFHFQSSSVCLILSSILLIAVAWLSSVIQPSLPMLVILIICDFELILKGPVISIRHFVSEAEKDYYHRCLYIILFILNSLFLFLWFHGMNHLASCLAIVIMICSISHIVCTIGKNRGLYY